MQVQSPLIRSQDSNAASWIRSLAERMAGKSSTVTVSRLAGLTTGFTGADIANLVNEAAIVATRRNGAAVNLNDFTEAIEQIVAGPEKRAACLMWRNDAALLITKWATR